MPKIISVGNLKGGTGKTLILYSIAAIIAEDGLLAANGEKAKKKVLIIDMDMQESATSCLKVYLSAYNKTTFDIFKSYVDSEMESLDPREIVVKTPIPELDLSIMPGSLSLHKVDMMIASQPARESILLNYMNVHKDFFDDYDLILIDTNPSMNMCNQNGFLASDEIILVSNIDIGALDGMEMLQALWGDIRKKLGSIATSKGRITGAIVNNYDSRTAMARDFVEYIDAHKPEISNIRFKTIVPTNVTLAESKMDGPINRNKKAKSYIALKRLIEEMNERGVFDE